MYAQFGQKWAKLHHGPLWSVAASDQLDDVTVGRNMKVVYTCKLNLTFERRIYRLKVNIPGLSERTLRRDFEKTGITLNAKIQVVHLWLM